MSDDVILTLMKRVTEQLPVLITYLLLVARFGSMLLLAPGIGGGARGAAVRAPAVLIFAAIATAKSDPVAMPAHWFHFIPLLLSEVVLGTIFGLLPLLIVAGVQTAAQMMSTSMGLGANQLMDPTSGSTVTDIARVMGDLTVIIFLLLDGHHVLITAATTTADIFPVGQFVSFTEGGTLLALRSADLFTTAVMVSAPVVVALLLTQLALGLISRAVPTINVFMMSFPITIGVGLLLIGLALPDTARYVERKFEALENDFAVLSQNYHTPQ